MNSKRAVELLNQQVDITCRKMKGSWEGIPRLAELFEIVELKDAFMFAIDAINKGQQKGAESGEPHA
jgi:hypothetical protein